MTKKTLYDVLQVDRRATSREIQQAYDGLRQRCEANADGLGDDDRRIRLVALRQAYETLSDSSAKAAYDAKLSQPLTPAAVADILPEPPKRSGGGAKAVANETRWMAIGIWLLLGIVGVWLVMQIINMLVVSRYLANNRPPADQAAQERAIIQDYYQETGIRAASKAEVDMLRAADRNAQEERRQAEQAKRDAERAEREYQHFVEDGRRLANEVSADLHREQVRQRREEEAARRETEEAARQHQEREEARREQERDRWRSVIRSNMSRPFATDYGD